MSDAQPIANSTTSLPVYPAPNGSVSSWRTPAGIPIKSAQNIDQKTLIPLKTTVDTKFSVFARAKTTVGDPGVQGRYGADAHRVSKSPLRSNSINRMVSERGVRGASPNPGLTRRETFGGGSTHDAVRPKSRTVTGRATSYSQLNKPNDSGLDLSGTVADRYGPTSSRQVGPGGRSVTPNKSSLIRMSTQLEKKIIGHPTPQLTQTAIFAKKQALESERNTVKTSQISSRNNIIKPVSRPAPKVSTYAKADPAKAKPETRPGLTSKPTLTGKKDPGVPPTPKGGYAKPKEISGSQLLQKKETLRGTNTPQPRTPVGRSGKAPVTVQKTGTEKPEIEKTANEESGNWDQEASQAEIAREERANDSQFADGLDQNTLRFRQNIGSDRDFIESGIGNIPIIPKKNSIFDNLVSQKLRMAAAVQTSTNVGIQTSDPELTLSPNSPLELPISDIKTNPSNRDGGSPREFSVDSGIVKITNRTGATDPSAFRPLAASVPSKPTEGLPGKSADSPVNKESLEVVTGVFQGVLDVILTHLATEKHHIQTKAKHTPEISHLLAKYTDRSYVTEFKRTQRSTQNLNRSFTMNDRLNQSVYKRGRTVHEFDDRNTNIEKWATSGPTDGLSRTFNFGVLNSLQVPRLEPVDHPGRSSIDSGFKGRENLVNISIGESIFQNRSENGSIRIDDFKATSMEQIHERKTEATADPRLLVATFLQNLLAFNSKIVELSQSIFANFGSRALTKVLTPYSREGETQTLNAAGFEEFLGDLGIRFSQADLTALIRLCQRRSRSPSPALEVSLANAAAFLDLSDVKKSQSSVATDALEDPFESVRQLMATWLLKIAAVRRSLANVLEKIGAAEIADCFGAAETFTGEQVGSFLTSRGVVHLPEEIELLLQDFSGNASQRVPKHTFVQFVQVFN